MLVGNGIAYGCVDDGLCVTVLAGRPDAAAMDALLCRYRGEHTMPRHSSLFDARALTGIDAEAFEALTRYVNDHREALARILDKQAIVRPSGLPGAVVDGFRSVFDFPYEASTFEDRDRAIAWLARSNASTSIEEIAAELAGDPIVGRVKALLAKNHFMTLEEAARELHLSERSLQRRLEEAGTTFRAASYAAHIAEAKRLLHETDRKLTAIAVALGYHSLQSFSASFRRATGVTPSAWRVRHQS